MTYSNFFFFFYELSFYAFLDGQSNMISLSCKLTGLPSLPTYSGDCSSSGKATLTAADICLKHITKETRLKAKIELQVCMYIYFNLVPRCWDSFGKYIVGES